MAEPKGGEKLGTSESGAKSALYLKEEAKREVVDEVKHSPVKALDTAPKMINRAKVVVDTKDAKPETKEAAKLKLDKAEGEFKDVVSAVNARAALLIELEGIDPEKDFSHAVEAIKKVKVKCDPIKKFFGDEDTVLDDVDNKEIAIQENAREHYNGLADKVDQICEDSDINSEKLGQLMQLVAEMQQAKLINFVGVTERESKKLETKFKSKSQLAFKVLNANYEVLNKDNQDAFNRLQGALVQLDDAEIGKNPAEKKKAKERIEMVIAEQEARRVWGNLPYDIAASESWRSADITEGVNEGWNKEGQNYKNYTEAVNAFNLGVEMSKRDLVDSSVRALQLFKIASNKWREVQRAYIENKKLESEEKEQQKEGQNKAKEKLNGIKTLADKLFQSSAKTVLSDEIQEYQQISLKLNGEVDEEYDYDEAITRIGELEKGLLAVEKKYESLKAKLGAKLEAAANHVSNAKEKTEGNVLKVVSDYMGDVYAHLDEDEQKMLAGMGLVKTLDLGVDKGLIFDEKNFKGEVWVTYGEDGDFKVEAGGYRGTQDEVLVEDLNESEQDLEKRKQAILANLNRIIDSAIAQAKSQVKADTPGELERDPDGYYIYHLKNKILKDYAKDAYRVNGGDQLQKNYEASLGLIVTKDITEGETMYKITAGRDENGGLVTIVEKFEKPKTDH